MKIIFACTKILKFRKQILSVLKIKLVRNSRKQKKGRFRIKCPSSMDALSAITSFYKNIKLICNFVSYMSCCSNKKGRFSEVISALLISCFKKIGRSAAFRSPKRFPFKEKRKRSFHLN